MKDRNVAVVYRAKDNAQLEKWQAELDTRIERYHQACTDLEAEYGRKIVHNTGLRGAHVTGYAPDKYGEEPKPGFRYDKKSGFMYPAKRTPEGKEIAQRLDAISLRVPAKPGLPEMVMGGGWMGPFHIEKLGGELGHFYATLGFDPTDEHHNDLDHVDLDLWEPVKRSEYWAAKEGAA